MAAVAHNPAFAKKVGIPQSVGKEFSEADKGKKFAGGGMAKKLFGGKETYSEELKEAKAIKSGRISPQQYAREEQKEERSMKMKKMADGGITQPVQPNFAADMARMSAQDALHQRGIASFSPTSLRKSALTPAPAAGQARMAKGGSVMQKKGMTTAKMGAVKTAAPSRDGIASKGKTRGTIVKMAGNKGMKYGGKC
jgi:hypothetical protein